MDHLIDYFEGLPRLDLIGICPVGHRDLYLRLCPGAPDDEIEQEFDEYAQGYRELLRRQSWDA